MAYTEEEARGKTCCRTLEDSCIASKCMAWEFTDGEWERVRTQNLTDDQKTMVKRIKSHPHELSNWKRPEGEPLPPPGEGWIPDGEMKEASNCAAGVFGRGWKRSINQRRGDCGLKREGI